MGERHKHEELAPLLRRSVPTSSLSNQEFDALLTRQAAVGESSLPDEPRPLRLPLHQQPDVLVQRESSSSSSPDVSEILSLHWSQHDPRAQGRPTNALEIPRYIEYDVQEELNARLDAIEEGFKTLCQRQDKRYETSSSLRQVVTDTPKIAVQQRYPTLQRYTSEEVRPLIDYEEQQRQVHTTRDFIRPIPKDELSPIASTRPRWKPRSLRTIQQQRQGAIQAASRSSNIPANESLYRTSSSDGRIRVEIKDDRISSSLQMIEGDKSERSSKKRASKRLGEMLSSKRTPRQESQTTFATDQRVSGSLFTGKSTTTMGTTKANPAAAAENPKSSQGETTRATTAGSKSKQVEIQPERIDSFRQRDESMKKVLQDVQRDEAERERQGLEHLKQAGGGDLSDSLKAFLQEFHSTQQATVDKRNET